MIFMNRKIILLIAVFMLISFVAAEELTQIDLTWNGAVSITLDKDIFLDGENITGKIKIATTEDYPLIGGIIVLQIAQGEYAYPSQFSSNDNTIFKKTISNIWVLPHTTKEIPFNIDSVGGGEFRLDTYFSVLRSKHTGASWIFLSPMSKSFSSMGEEKARVSIFRPTTEFNNTRGPVGFPIESGGEITGNVTLLNETNEDITNLKIGILLCDWSIGFCDENAEVFNVGKINAGEVFPANITFNAPSLPSAYEINISVYDEEKIHSIYKSRVIVSGGTAKLRKISIDGFDKKDYSLRTVFSGSPDHFAYPTFSNFSLKMQIFSNENIIQEETENYNLIETSEIREKIFDIASKNFDKVCLLIEKANIIYDDFCFDVPLKEIQEAYDIEYPEIVEVDWEYNDITEELKLNLSKSIPINARIRIYKDNSEIYNEELKNKNDYSKSISVPAENMTMLIDDFDAKNQQTISLNLSLTKEEKDAVETGNGQGQGATVPCTGQVCPNGFVCSSNTYISSEGSCCTSQCIPSVESDGFILLGIPIIFWIAIILVIIAIAVVSTTIQRVKNK